VQRGPRSLSTSAATTANGQTTCGWRWPTPPLRVTLAWTDSPATRPRHDAGQRVTEVYRALFLGNVFRALSATGGVRDSSATSSVCTCRCPPASTR
jgi:hypothetical protein